jgi:DHA3 family tetracycline resistance protein-like MFS transporter
MAYVATAASLLILEVVNRRVDLEDDRAVARALLLLNTVLIGAVAAFALAGNLAFALAAFWIFSPLRRVNEPIIQAWQNRFIPSAVRATVLSLGVQVDAIGQIAGGPLLGALAVGLSMRAALLAAALIMLPALAIYVLLLRGAQRAAAAIE